MMIGTFDVSRIRRQNSRPFMPGISRSPRISAGGRASTLAIADSASLAVRTSYPRPRMLLTSSATCRSSSTTSTLGPMSPSSFFSFREHVNRLDDLRAARLRVPDRRAMSGKIREFLRIDVLPALADTGGGCYGELHRSVGGGQHQRPGHLVVFVDRASHTQGRHVL